MTIKQIFLKWLYPAFRWLAAKKSEATQVNTLFVKPQTSIYDLEINLPNQQKLSLQQFQGKNILFVNTASDCGYTAQYDDLQKLYEQMNDSLVIIGFPSNDFKNQESKSDEEINAFCKLNFGVTFPLAIKSVVSKLPEQNSVFNWLTHKELNGWNNTAPYWNFTKYLVNESGILTHVFHPATSPLSKEVVKEL
jgi:glutathione peroxidase